MPDIDAVTVLKSLMGAWTISARQEDVDAFFLFIEQTFYPVRVGLLMALLVSFVALGR